jgi:hypothetical protein
LSNNENVLLLGLQLLNLLHYQVHRWAHGGVTLALTGKGRIFPFEATALGLFRLEGQSLSRFPREVLALDLLGMEGRMAHRNRLLDPSYFRGGEVSLPHNDLPVAQKRAPVL